MAARIIETRTALAARISEVWAGKGVDDGVLTPWAFRIEAARHQGRKVYVFPASYTNPAANRAEDQGDYSFTVLVVERFAPAGDPTDAWVDERCSWTEWLVNTLGDVRAPNLLAAPNDPSTGLWAEVAEVTTVYDLEELTERKIFISAITLTYREERN